MKFEDTYIYKYCSFEIGELIVSSQLLKFNNPSSFNDPFDCDINLLEFDFSDCCVEVLNDIETVRNNLLDNYNEKDIDEALNDENIHELYKKSLINRIERSSISCFSLNPADRTMWSHYADKHKGLCLVFDLGVINRFKDKEINRRMNSGIVDYKELKPVNYLKDKKKGINNLFFTKSMDWSYEKEVRLFILEKDMKFIQFNKEFLKGIILGANVEEIKIEKFKTTIRFSDFEELSLARLKKSDLKLVLEDIPV